MAEKRRSKRIAITAVAEASFPDGKTLTAYVANLSREGIGIYFKEPLVPGTELTLKLSYHDEQGALKSKDLGGEVKWSYNGFYAVGIGLKGLNDKEHGDLLEYIRSVEERDKG
jgi:hypothetical protein